MATYSEHVRSLTALKVSSGHNGQDAVDQLIIKGTANTAAADIPTITNAAFGQASTLTIPDPGVSNANFVLAPSSSSVTLTSTVTMTAAQVTGAYTAPVQLVPAPGTGLCIMVLGAWVSTHYDGSTAFATGTTPIIQYANTVHGAGTIAVGTGLVTGDIEATTDQTRNLGAKASAALTGLSNLGVYFSSATAYTAGGAGTVSITLSYVIVASAN